MVIFYSKLLVYQRVLSSMAHLGCTSTAGIPCKTSCWLIPRASAKGTKAHWQNLDFQRQSQGWTFSMFFLRKWSTNGGFFHGNLLERATWEYMWILIISNIDHHKHPWHHKKKSSWGPYLDLMKMRPPRTQKTHRSKGVAHASKYHVTHRVTW